MIAAHTSTLKARHLNKLLCSPSLQVRRYYRLEENLAPPVLHLSPADAVLIEGVMSSLYPMRWRLPQSSPQRLFYGWTVGCPLISKEMSLDD